MARSLLEDPRWTVELRSSTPRWFHQWMLGERCRLEYVELDPGVVQRDAFHHDARATRRAWQELLGQAHRLVPQEVTQLRRSGCAVVIGDMVPLAFAAAHEAGLPALALGNFTWDWILEYYLDQEPGLAPVITTIRRLYGLAGGYLRLPMSHETDVFARQLQLPLVARRADVAPETIRRQLGLEPSQILILLCFGGVGFDGVNLEQVARHADVRCVWDRPQTRRGVLLSVAGSEIRYPDLIRAADVVLTKPGYGIIAEAVAHQTALAYAHRGGFRESPMLERFLRRSWPSLELTRQQLGDGSWAEPVVTLARRPGELPVIPWDGAERAAEAIRDAAAGRKLRGS